MNRFLLRAPAVVAVLLAAATTACSGKDEVSTSSAADRSTTTTTPLDDAAPYEFTFEDRTYTRTAESGTARELLTEVWTPTGAGPFPVVVFAHGFDGNPKKFHQLFQVWAEAGYAVVAPRFPVSADEFKSGIAASVADAPEQTKDLAFVLEQALADDADDGEDSGGLDADRIAVGGLSLGGGTALQASYTDCCGLDPKFVMALSPAPFGTEQSADAPPLLLIHGTSDPLLPYKGSSDLFAQAPNKRWFVTLDGALHSQPYEDAPSAHDELVRQVTLGLLDQYLGDDDEGVERAEAAIAASGNASVQSAG